ncbi:hypothetical protein K1719_002440 [Acacia pycnantha]|nr:hypothetical protein K1719_002440 [Acacia pycnantha]
MAADYVAKQAFDMLSGLHQFHATFGGLDAFLDKDKEIFFTVATHHSALWSLAPAVLPTVTVRPHSVSSHSGTLPLCVLRIRSPFSEETP